MFCWYLILQLLQMNMFAPSLKHVVDHHFVITAAALIKLNLMAKFSFP